MDDVKIPASYHVCFALVARGAFWNLFGLLLWSWNGGSLVGSECWIDYGGLSFGITGVEDDLGFEFEVRS